MQLSTQLDVDLIAVESDDEVSVLVELTAPTPASTSTRQPATVQIVLDRSGSMGDGRLEHAKRALLELVDRLDPSDNFGVVAFDDEVQVVVPAGPLTDKQGTKLAIASVFPGGSTDLSAGYVRGLQEVQRVAGAAGATLLLVSDGHANAGITDPDALAGVAATAAGNTVTTSTIGMGLGYDERLLAAIANGGRGTEHFAEESDTAAAVIAGEVDGLLTQVAQACSLRVTLAPEVKAATLLNQLPAVGLSDGFMVELGSLYAGETRKLVLRLALPGLAALGLHQVATLTLTHVSLPDLVQNTATMPVTVNVVPGDQAAGRVRSPEVTKEALFQQTQRTKKKASDLLSEGRVEEARRLLADAGTALQDAASGMDEVWASELHDEVRIMSALADESGYDSMRASKALSSDYGSKSRSRGRARRAGAFCLRWGQNDDDLDVGTLVVAEWEMIRLMRDLPTHLADALRSADGIRDERIAHEVALLAQEPSVAAFFLGASCHGGFTVDRA